MVETMDFLLARRMDWSTERLCSGPARRQAQTGAATFDPFAVATGSDIPGESVAVAEEQDWQPVGIHIDAVQEQSGSHMAEPWAKAYWRPETRCDSEPGLMRRRDEAIKNTEYISMKNLSRAVAQLSCSDTHR